MAALSTCWSQSVKARNSRCIERDSVATRYLSWCLLPPQNRLRPRLCAALSANTRSPQKLEPEWATKPLAPDSPERADNPRNSGPGR